MITLIVYTGFTFGIYKDTGASLNESRRQFTQSQRPWVWINERDNNIYVFKKYNTIRWVLAVKNFGATPALNVAGYLEPFGDFPWWTNKQWRMDYAFGRMLEDAAKKQRHFFLIPPGSEQVYRIQLSWTPQMFSDEGLPNMDAVAIFPTSWTVTGQITYQDEAGNNYESDICTVNYGRQFAKAPPEIGTCGIHNEMH